VITRAVGTEADVDVDTFSIRPTTGDLFLICSDGLTDMVDDRAITEAVAQHRQDLDQAAKALVKAANRVGGEDNITVVFFELTADEGVETEVTQRAPAIEQATSEDEDTLSGIDAVPAVDTMVVPLDEVGALVPEPAPHRRRGLTVPLLLAFALLLIIAASVLWLAERL
jgi:hypothetical protein